MHAQWPFHRLAALALAAAAVLTGWPSASQAQVVDPSQLDHLKCYRIKDSLQPKGYRADLTNQFGVEPGCVVMQPARALCVETDKRITSSPAPPGGGPSGTPAGHFLCYAVRCPTKAAPDDIAVEDQFGRRVISIEQPRILCAPANKLICGDGEVDPGEACDPGSAATNQCPDGSPCNADCTCPPGVCCQCGDGNCTTGNGTVCPPGCSPVPGASCGANGLCEVCPCGQDCTDDAGNVGICRSLDGVAPCECMSTPACPCGATCTVGGLAGVCQETDDDVCECRPQQACVCGDTCNLPDGVAGHCRPSSTTNVCECRPDTPPDCPCEATCETAAGRGHCRPTSDAAVCECRPDPPPECPCDSVCTDASGQVGVCRHRPGNPGGVCSCFIPPPPPECPCGKTCVDANGLAGQCRPVPGGSGLCTCIAAPPSEACQCGKPCVGNDGQAGRCRPIHGSPGQCGCVTG
jgi:hypothetical protein